MIYRYLQLFTIVYNTLPLFTINHLPLFTMIQQGNYYQIIINQPGDKKLTISTG